MRQCNDTQTVLTISKLQVRDCLWNPCLYLVVMVIMFARFTSVIASLRVRTMAWGKVWSNFMCVSVCMYLLYERKALLTELVHNENNEE